MTNPGRNGLVVWTALILAVAALALSGWSAIVAMRTRDDIRRLGDVLSRGGGSLRMSLDPPPPRFDPDDR